MTKKGRLLSLFLAFIIIFTMLPMQVFADESLHNGLSGTYNWIPTGYTHWGDPSLVNDLKSMNGYKISVWFADVNGQDENGNPTYAWGDPQKSRQIGRTVYFRRTPLETYSGKTVGMDFWSDGDIYSQTTLGWGWDDSKVTQKDAIEEGIPFPYATTYMYLEDSEGEYWKGCKAYFENLRIGLISLNSCGYSLYDIAFSDKDYVGNYGFVEVRDFFCRMLDMEHPEKVDLKKFYNCFYKNYVENRGRKIENLTWDVTLCNDGEALLRALIDTVGDYYEIPIKGHYNLDEESEYIENYIDKIPTAKLATEKDFQLPFPSAMKEKEGTKGINNASAEYLKSYF